MLSPDSLENGQCIQFYNAQTHIRFASTCQLQQQSMSSLKSKKKTESQLALDALIHTSKSITAVLVFLLAYLGDLHLLILIAISLPLFVYTFIAIQQKSFVTLYMYFKKALMFKKIHNFFDEVKMEKVELPIKGYFDKESPRKSFVRQRNDGFSPKSPISQPNSADDRIHAPTFILPPKQEEEYEQKPYQHSSIPETQAEKKDYQRIYLKVREQYKKSFELICGKQANRQQFQDLVSKIRSFYRNRVSQLLLMNRINLKQIKEQLEKHYQVHILQHETSQHKAELVNITIDDAVERLIQYENVKCFPWTDKLEWEASDIKNHYHKIERIARDRKEIDRFLAPYVPLNQKLREEIVDELERQMTQPSSLGSQLAYTVAEIYNDKLKQSKISEEYFIFKQGIANSPCLKLIKTRIGPKLHLDLQLKRTAKIDILACNPGDNNLWTLIAFAVEILKRKL